MKSTLNFQTCARQVRLFSVVFAAMLAITFAGTADAQRTGRSRQGLAVKEVRLWTENNNLVPVCWETPGYDREKEIVMNAVNNTWGRFSQLRFEGWWLACPTGIGISGSGTAKAVRIRISPQGKDDKGNYIDAGAGGSARLGMDALSSADDRNPGMNMSFAPDGSADKGRVEYVAVHEFGHVLGFIHEQDAPNHNAAHCTGSTEANATSLTDYDPDSVMNYCNKDGNMKGNLTNKDIKGLWKIYGVRRDRGISGVLLAGKFRTQEQLSWMSAEDQRNTLITELVGRTKDTVRYYQSLNDANLAGRGALLVYMRRLAARTDQQIKTMSAEDIRNTLIVELVGRTRDTVNYYQSLNDSALAGAVALLVYLRENRSRTDQQIKTMSADDMRNTVIVEVGSRTGRDNLLQALSNLNIVSLALE